MVCQFNSLNLQEEVEEVGETAPKDLWTSKPLDFSHWYFQHDDKTKLLTVIKGSSVDVAKRGSTDSTSEFVSEVDTHQSMIH